MTSSGSFSGASHPDGASSGPAGAVSARYRDDLTRVTVRGAARVGGAVLVLAFMSGVYLGRLLSLPFWLSFAGTLALLGWWAVRHHGRLLRRDRALRLQVDATRLAVGRNGELRTIVTRDRVRDITYDDEDVIAVYSEGAEPVLRVGLRALENRDAFWSQLQAWRPPRQVPRGDFDVVEPIVTLVFTAGIFGLTLLGWPDAPEGATVGSVVCLGVLAWGMWKPWRHRHASSAARRILWIAAGFGAVIALRIAYVVPAVRP